MTDEWREFCRQYQLQPRENAPATPQQNAMALHSLSFITQTLLSCEPSTLFQRLTIQSETLLAIKNNTDIIEQGMPATATTKTALQTKQHQKDEHGTATSS
jgi:hypothetical protein